MGAFADALGALFADPNVGRDAVYIAAGGTPILVRVVTAHAVYLPIPRVEIAGPQGVQASFDWQAAKAASPARMCTATLVNTVTGY